MSALRQAVEEFLEQEGWNFGMVEGQSTLAMTYRGKNGTWNCYLHLDEERGVVSFYSVTMRPVAEPRRETVAQFLTRANFGLVLGNFELDMADGETRFKTSVELGPVEIRPELLRPVVYANVAAMDRYLPGLDGVAEDRMTPQEAMSLCEG